MVKIFLPAVAVLLTLSSCTSFKTLNFTSNKQVSLIAEPAALHTKFIDEIDLTPQTLADNAVVKTEKKQIFVKKLPAKEQAVVAQRETDLIATILANRSAEVEGASSIQLKYAVLMDTEVESLPSKPLLEAVDEWFGVRYRTGGNTKSGIDCSGFTVAVYAAVYGLAIPRVSREQYSSSRKISTTELKEGDLVFFNTNGRGVSHVGVYLGNNKFIHASVSRGIMVNDLFEPYYLKRFIGGGTIDEKHAIASN